MPAHNPQLLDSLDQLHISPPTFPHRPEPKTTPPGSHQENNGAHIPLVNSPVQPIASPYSPQPGPNSIPTPPGIERQSSWGFPQYAASPVQSSAPASALCTPLGSTPTSPVLGLQHSNTFPQYVNSPAQLPASAPTCPPRPGPTRTSTGSSQTSSGSTPTSPKDEQTSSWGKRFVGNHLVARGVRASFTTTTASAKLPLTFSPWGDNNPVTLPNVRARDIVFAGVSQFGGDVIAQGVGEAWSSDLLQDAMDHFTEVIKKTVIEPLDKKTLLDGGNLGQFSPKEEAVLKTTSVKSIKVSIKHKLMGVNAEIRLFLSRPCPILQRSSCARAWFCPFLYASGRTPSINRAETFGIAQCIGPGLEADTRLAHKLLTESGALITLCDADPGTNIDSYRMIILFTGISPWRLNAWSQSRVPDGARLQFHLFNGCPSLVIPVQPQAPILAWAPATLKQMHSDKFEPSEVYLEIFRGLDSIVNLEAVHPLKRENYNLFLAKGIKMIMQSAIGTKEADAKILEHVDADRAGIVMFRY